ncbi:MAG: NAD-dependent epimerase/dehydratase family protein [Chitinispirillaceae bacterium]|nr:NAD-dependent epimerase/dehydratase family protein [Chitinispirillaceae bacterium]
MKKKQTIGIIGCGGFIGSHLLERVIADHRYRIMGIDRSVRKIEHLLHHPGVTVTTADIYTFDGFEAWIDRCDVVVSLAALCNPALYNTIPLTVIESNFTMPARIVDLCARTKKRLVHFSTSEVYGRTVQSLSGYDREEHYLLREDDSPLILGPVHAQRWSYASAKQLLERLIIGYGLEQELRYTIVRPFNFIGPRMDYLPGIDGEGVPRVFACFMKALLCREPLQLVDGGENRRCFTAISDAVGAIIRIIERPQECAGQIINIGNPANETSMRDLAVRMREICGALTGGADSPLQTVSSELFYGKGYEDSDRRVPDISKARSLLGWEPRTGLDDALRIGMVSYLEQYRKLAA